MLIYLYVLRKLLVVNYLFLKIMILLNNFDNTIFFKRFITQIACQDHLL